MPLRGTSDDHQNKDSVVVTSSQPLRMLQNLWFGVPLVQKGEAVCCSYRKGQLLMRLFQSVCLGILKEKLPRFLTIHDCDTLQHDGAPCLQAKVVKNWLAQNHVQLLAPWPGNSSDLKPIENCWMMLKRKVAGKNPSSVAH